MPLNDSKPPERKSPTMKERFNVLSCIALAVAPSTHPSRSFLVFLAASLVFSLLSLLSSMSYVIGN